MRKPSFPLWPTPHMLLHRLYPKASVHDTFHPQVELAGAQPEPQHEEVGAKDMHEKYAALLSKFDRSIALVTSHSPGSAWATKAYPLFFVGPSSLLLCTAQFRLG